ncbi:Chemotaxis response regulator protein-glutamate methylesterase [Thalassovita gelatinovora]|uniref:Chemotaxis response regulator protein-glutamate methylesterase n=1 Tax=Thalassovita gelatinovora TaxID=53501 RepID=A0A0P1FL47_THAGE|nr:response regulator [Thalassovita gelatinovora]QIZ78981.1 response regulator [Thalassovita gelatinovora]CUH68509.1 Chemotaxis response regulator protein-glutamate methylesterase [Thalassovita gelatinovora]SEQ53744.1 two-component system, chemotaxis family, response regulator CheY [Thalassovita gelatinovora]
MSYKVMIVDDAAMMRLYISSFLKSLPEFNMVAQAANGQEALDKLLDYPDLDLILLDIEMPVMDGLEFLRHAKLKTRAKICMLSSVTVQGSPHAAKARELGADGVVAKPSGTVSHDLEEKTGDELRDTMRRLVAA